MKLDDKAGYLAPWLSQDLNKWMKEHPELRITDIARRCGISRQVFRANFVTGQSPTVNFLARYAVATERDIPGFFADVGSIVNLQAKGVYPFGKKPEPLIYRELRQQTLPEKKPKNKKQGKAYLLAKPVVEEWQKNNPGKKQKYCVIETGLSASAVSRHWNKDLAKKKE